MNIFGAWSVLDKMKRIFFALILVGTGLSMTGCCTTGYVGYRECEPPRYHYSRYERPRTYVIVQEAPRHGRCHDW